MKTITSVSGGKTSAYVAANYPADHLLFALVRTDDESCKYPDKKLRKEVEDRIGKPFVGTLEEDAIIHTMLDLEQYLGKKINWVSGPTFDEVLETKGGWLPNKLHRYCTTNMKIVPMFYWWAENVSDPIKMNIGFRVTEQKRAAKMNKRRNENGLLTLKATFEKHDSGRHKGLNKWEHVEWQDPQFPLIEDHVFKAEIENYWVGKPVRFAERNNCVGCFHRNAHVLKEMSEKHPDKFEWFAKQEGEEKKFWKSNTSYKKIQEIEQVGVFDDRGVSGCDSGYCGL